MSLTYQNAFLETDDPAVVQRGGAHKVTKTMVVTSFPERFEGESGIEICRNIQSPEDVKGQSRIYLSTLEADHDIIDACAAHVAKTDAVLYVRAFSDLTETGRIEAMYKLSPAMLLSRLGILGRCVLVGGVHLDRDDIALFEQHGARLIVLPLFDMLSGHGIAPIMNCIKYGIDVRIGTGSPRYNFSGDIRLEALTLQAASSALMERCCLIPQPALFKMCAAGSEAAFYQALYCQG